MHDPPCAQRYWARSLIGWRSFGRAQPNVAHHALAALERRGAIGLLATQNVDGLHQAAGSRRVIDLHGRLDRVDLHVVPARLGPRRLAAASAGAEPVWAGLDAPIAPDGDADLDGLDFTEFVVPDCPAAAGSSSPTWSSSARACRRGGIPRRWRSLADSDAMLVVGSSLMVHSGYRYALAADRLGKPIAAVNLGRTRADHLLSLKVEAPAGATLDRLVRTAPA